jgi:hypothetical protein
MGVGMANFPENPTEIDLKMPANPDEFQRKMLATCEEQKRRRGPYLAYQKADQATMAIVSARTHLVEIIKRDALTTEDILRHISIALVHLGEADCLVKDTTQAWRDYIGDKSLE